MVWRLLQDALLRTFGALTGPEPVLYYRSPEAVPGTWRPEEGKTAKTLLDTCDALPEAERPEVAREILRRTALAEPGPLEDPDLVALADEVFRDLEHAEEPR